MSTENTVTRALIEVILASGHKISIFDCDGGQPEIENSREAKDIFDECVAQDMVTLRAYSALGGSLGGFLLVYGNADDGSELIADHTANDFCDTIYHLVSPEGEE